MATTVLERTEPLVKAHALRDARGGWRVAVIHKDYNASAPSTMTVMPSGGPAAAGS